MPALLTRTSTRPNSAMVASTSAWQSSGRATSVRTAIARRPASSTASLRLGQPVDPAGAEGDVGAGLGQRPREGDAEARGGAGDDRDLAVQPEHVQDRASATELPLSRPGACRPVTGPTLRRIPLRSG